jgi:hypothetical protein
MKGNKYIVCSTVMVVISGTTPLWWMFGDWDCIEKHEEAMKNQSFKQVLSSPALIAYRHQAHLLP